MGPTNLSIEEKAEILAWEAENVPSQEISMKTGRGENVRCLIVAVQNLPPNIVPLQKNVVEGQKRLARLQIKNLWITANVLKIKLPSLLGEMAERTIQHRLQKDLNMPTFKPAHKPFITRQMVIKRVQFAKKHKNWTVEDWSNVLWSDESKFLCVK